MFVPKLSTELDNCIYHRFQIEPNFMILGIFRSVALATYVQEKNAFCFLFRIHTYNIIVSQKDPLLRMYIYVHTHVCICVHLYCIHIHICTCVHNFIIHTYVHST